MFAPEIYAGVEVSGGVYNMNYYIFLFMTFGNMIYIAGALRNRLACRGGNSSPAGGRLLLGAALLAIVYLYICKGDLKSTLAYCSLEYITSGQAADFKAQMELQNSVLLDDDVKDVVLPMINDDQGPLMHMPLTENPDEWTNMVTRLYYNKNSVVAIPREVWQELQGR